MFDAASFMGRGASRRVFSWFIGLVLLLVAEMPAWGALAIDATVSTHRSTAGTTIASPRFSTTSSNELLLAFVATDATAPGTSVTGVTGAGLTWVLVQRSNAQPGTSEIWRAFATSPLSSVAVKASLSQSVAGSITVVSFTGADTTGQKGAGAIGATAAASADSGAPSASLFATRDGGWVFGVGNDFDSATPRTVPDDQVMVDEDLASNGDTYWVQRQAGPTAVRGASVTINDTAPTSDRWNLALAEVLPATPWGAIQRPDLTVVIPTGRMSVTGTGADRVLNYTHDTFNRGSGPLVIQPAYSAVAGYYLGTQYLYALSGSTWTLKQKLPLAGAFVFDPDHGHFHFPFASFGLYTVGSDGGPGAPVAISGKVGFCIDDSFIYAPQMSNAGQLGNLGSCSDPTSLRGLDIGAVDEYDQTDPGQSISLAGVPDGRYWLRAIADPENFLFESDKSNNETDVLLDISGNTVTELQQVTPVLPPPPVVTVTSPANGSTVSGTITLAASPPAGAASVQFLVNGSPLGAPVGSPYTLAWDTTTVPDGSSWLAAQTTDAVSGRTGTSKVVRVTVSNGVALAPVVTLTSPDAGQAVSAVSMLGADVAATPSPAAVQFRLDGSPIGPRLTKPPYLFAWDSRGISDGTHQLTAVAVDAAGRAGASPARSLVVDNAHLPRVIGVDARVSRDGAGVLTTPAFSTTTSADVLVAFVAYDGPAMRAQSASVSGAGLAWRLVMRSNTERGTAEVWTATATAPLRGGTVRARPTLGGARGSLVVAAFTNASGVGIVGRAGAPSGASHIYLPGVSVGDWVFAVGNDARSATARVPVEGQVIVHQRVDTAAGSTSWVQSTPGPAGAHALVDIRDVAPAASPWNYAAVAVVAARP